MAALAVLLGCLVLAPSAGAHDSHGWYWSTWYTEKRLESRYPRILTADCVGFGQWMWSDPNAFGQKEKLYRHLDCFDTTMNGRHEEGIVHVKGRRAMSYVLF